MVEYRAQVVILMEEHFIRIDPANDAYRVYALALWPDLFGGVSLLREWGRIGQPRQLRLDRYEDEEQAGSELRRLAASKQKRGYRQIVPRTAFERRVDERPPVGANRHQDGRLTARIGLSMLL